MNDRKKLDPFERFGDWFARAQQVEPSLPEAMALATVGPSSRPSLRMVLMKEWGPGGWIFYTNFDSRKGQELANNPNAALLFHWKTLKKQVRIEGLVVPVADDEADAYFATRGRSSQIGAWASRQSRVLEGRFALEANVAKFAAKFHVGAVPRPDFWSGFRLKADVIEFWSERKSRLHERHVYTRVEEGWTVDSLYP